MPMRFAPLGALAVVALAAGSFLGRAERSTALGEFAGAYPILARPNGIVRTFDLVAAPADVTFGDGRRLGETLRVRFTNRLPQPTTIHWHGVRVPNAMDGVPGVTQPAIQPGESFVYEFTPKDAGTFWFHPHLRSSEQIERGLFGVLVVEDRLPRPYSRDVVWV